MVMYYLQSFNLLYLGQYFTKLVGQHSPGLKGCLSGKFGVPAALPLPLFSYESTEL
jgi:hypothetical protein